MTTSQSSESLLKAAIGKWLRVVRSVFVVFYIPCLATLSVLRRELGTRAMFSIAGITVVIALLAAFVARLAALAAGPLLGVL